MSAGAPKTAAVIGLGLIGGSFARSAKAAGLRVIGVDVSAVARRAALEAGVADEVSDSAAAVAGADEVFVATPVGAFASVFAELAGSVREDAAVFDGGSCKREAMRAAEALGARRPRFVPSHPIAGHEDSGFEASSADLFKDRWAVLCPEGAAPDAIETTAAAWRRCGAKIAEMTAESHDEIFAAVSHLPHLLSFALVEALRARKNRETILRYAAGGFRDFTRIAGSDPVMWADVCIQNADCLLAACGDFRRELENFEDLVRAGDREALREKFAAARALRRRGEKKQLEAGEGGA